MTPRVLVLYATNHGHTRRVAGRVAAGLAASGLDPVVMELDGRDDGPPPAGYDGAAIAASVHAGHHQKQIERWARRHASMLSLRPNALLSVSLSAADSTEEGRADAHRCAEELADDTGWTPGRIELVAGALQYREYDVATRVLMRLIARHHGISTDTKEDVEFTDWDALDQFASGFAATVIGAARRGQRAPAPATVGSRPGDPAAHH